MFSDDAENKFVWVVMLLVDTNFKHRLTDLHMPKLIMRVLTFRAILW